jgi:periplasmic copper chaperone A
LHFRDDRSRHGGQATATISPITTVQLPWPLLYDGAQGYGFCAPARTGIHPGPEIHSPKEAPMSLRSLVTAAAASILLTLPVFAGDASDVISVEDGYVRAVMANAKSAAIYMLVTNNGEVDDRLIGVSTGIAKRADLHTSMAAEGGVMKMMPIEGGIEIPAGAFHVLQRGGDHIMLMGVSAPLAEGDTVAVTLRFEQAGTLVVDVPIVLGR